MSPHHSRNNDELLTLSRKQIFEIPCKKKFSWLFKELLWNASGRACAYCGEELAIFEDMAVDHFHPSSRGGSDDLENLVCCCNWCNSSKINNNIESFRINLAIKKSPIYKIITANQALKLIDAGVFLPINLGIEFHYEVIK